MQQNPNVDLAFTVTGLSGFMQSNQGFMFALLKDPEGSRAERR